MDRKLHVGTLILIPPFKIYVFLYSRQTDGRADRQTAINKIQQSSTNILKLSHRNRIQWCIQNKLIRCGLPSLHSSRSSITPAACGLEELFSAVLERFLQPIHALRVYCKNQVGNTSKQEVNFYKFSCRIRIYFSHIGIGIWRGWTTDRKLHVGTLILIPTFKIYVFSYYGRTNGQTNGLTDGEINPVWAG